MERTPQATTRAQLLLQRIIAAEDLTVDELARELVVPLSVLGQYISGDRPIPLARQLCLAKLVIDRVPRLRRQGYSLRGQVSAAISIEGRLELRIT